MMGVEFDTSIEKKSFKITQIPTALNLKPLMEMT
jgi:hypothetical protein